jgi:hypothetical protein
MSDANDPEPPWVVIVLVLPRSSLRALQNMTATLSGIGRTATEIKTSTTTIGRSCGTDAIAGAPNDFLQLARIETGQ